MKFHPALLALLAAQSTALAAVEAKPPVQMPEGCSLMIRTALAALESDWLVADEGSGNVTIDKEMLAQESIKNLKVLHSACLGPADCDAQNPDAFTYGGTIGKTGKIVVSYHRGHCSISKFSIN